VAATLTILGYSVHDTIVIFDRMRENTLGMKRETYAEMVDLCIRQTMVRSINTSVALLLPLVAILVFGGPTLKDFALALTIGVIAGTYSSFFVAAPLAVIWKSREPRYRKRIALAGAGGGTFVAGETVPEPSGDGGKTGVTSPAKSGAGGRPASKQGGGSSRSTKGRTTSKRPPGK
jgi:SecD/SecF fusion protein